MSIHVAEDLHRPAFRFTDPDAFLSCDNLMCSSARVTAAGLVVSAIEDDGPSGSRFTEHLLVACSLGAATAWTVAGVVSAFQRVAILREVLVVVAPLGLEGGLFGRALSLVFGVDADTGTPNDLIAFPNDGLGITVVRTLD